MSNQTAQRMRRNNGSPSTTKQGPIKAVQAFSLRKSNSSKAKSSSTPSPRDSNKLWNIKSPDHRLSPERKSPNSTSPSLTLSPNNVCVGQQTNSSISGTISRSHTHGHHSLSHKEKKNSKHSSGKWRPSSADTVVPSYLTGQWPKDIIHNYHHYQNSGVFKCDKSTQTIEDCENKVEKRKRGHRRSASFGQGDQLKLQYIKHHLQKSKEGSKHSDGKQRSSPIQGNHSALSMTAPPALMSQQTKTILISARGQNMNRYQRNSVEGLNTEIEKLVNPMKSVSVSVVDAEDVDLVFYKEIPDGHRAPLPEQANLSSTRNVDTQTPSSPASISPNRTPPRPSSVDVLRNSGIVSRSDSTESKSSSKGEVESSPEPSTHLNSPKLEKSCPFVREPPDGCEKVMAVEETKRPQIKGSLLCAPTPSQVVFKQSQGSAFCPLIKSLLVDGELGKSLLSEGELSRAYTCTSPVLSTGVQG